MLKKLLGIAPRKEADGSYSPSKLALKLATTDKTDFERIAYQKYEGNRSKVLVICTEEKNLNMKNGTLFSTGNHPVETLVPMLHLKDAGFDFEIATPSGKSAVFEMWAFPQKDEQVHALYQQLKASFESPISLAEFIGGTPPDPAEYAAIFVPGGHGAMIGIPEDQHVGAVLRWAHDMDLYTISICHGPGAFLATTVNDEQFLYSGYQMAVFPDAVDKQTPMIGYLPGQMPHGVSEPLKELGADVVNTKSDKTVCLDRKLITGASPLASNELGKLAAYTLLEGVK